MGSQLCDTNDQCCKQEDKCGIRQGPCVGHMELHV